MSNSGRSWARDDRFYSPPAMRKHNQQLKVQQEPERVRPQKRQEKKGQSESLVTNLDRFMKNITPIVTAQHFPKTSMNGWRNHENYHPYFVLGDLWESFKEWSAYGAGVPLVLNESDSVVQYYVPFLSAIQLYADRSAPVARVRRPGEDSDSESSRATSSDGSYEAGGMGHGHRVQENNGNCIAPSFNKLTLGEEGEIRNPPGLLVYEYFAHDQPYHRAPLADQILELSSRFPALRTYRSCDLTQSSWFSVAWYPIYRIPVGPSLQNVDACFLTFHSLSTPLTSRNGDHAGSTVREVHDMGMPLRLSLPIFGLGVYKLKPSDWTKSGVHGIEKVNSMIHSTENWLRSLGVNHPDFNFFKARDILKR